MQFSFNGYLLDTDRRELTRGAKPIAVEPQVFDLLAYLVQHRDRVVTKGDLLEAVWGGRIVSGSALTTRINAARRAVGDSGEAQRLIRTLPRKGVRFIAKVEEQVTSLDCAALPRAAESSERPSIAVLPFQNLSDDPELEYFADGLVEEIITALGRTRGLLVIAGNSTLTYKRQAIDVQRVGREFGLRHVLEGSVRKGGNRLRITAQLIDAATGAHLWADRFDGSLDEVLEAQERIASGIAGAIETMLRAGERAGSLTIGEPALEPSGTAERRQLTVMFCDLVGATALAARLDPEDLHMVLGTYHTALREAVGRFGGSVAKSIGGGALVSFGYPEAHEDDAERAVRAGLALVDSVGRLDVGGEPLAIRVGIATGLVLVGDLPGVGGALEHAVVGEASDLAGRLQAMAEPGAILLDQQTRRLVGGMFDCSEICLRGGRRIDEPVSMWQVLRPSQTESRFEALRGPALTPLVGRQEEIEILLRRWFRAKAGDGQVVLISGEPGIGKSRLTLALQQRISPAPHTRIRYFCSPHRQDSAFHPVIAQIEHAAGFERSDDAETKLDKLASLFRDNGPVDGDIGLIAELLSVPGGERYPPPDLTPQRKKERIFAALLRQLDGISSREPVLMIIEDLHWIDPTSRELVDHLVERTGRYRVLLVLTFRPEFRAPWVGQPGVTALALGRLGRADATALVRYLTAERASLPPDIIAEIVEHTDGVPLFVEEMTKAVLEADSDPVAIASIPASSLGIPATLHASLLARLDRLGPAAKQVAQAGAAIGREFSYELLAASVGELGEGALNEALYRLVEAGLVFQRGTPPAANYLFKHALIQDIAYSTLLRRMRQDMHRRIAEALEARFPSLIEAQPEIAAHHFGEALETGKAVAYWHRAGQVSVAKSAVREADTQLRRGLDLLRSLPESDERKRRELDFHITLTAALMGARGYADPEIAALLERSQRLVTETGGLGSALHFSVLYGIWVVAYVGGKARRLLDLASEFQSFAETQATSGPCLIGHRLLGASLMVVGNYREALPHLRLAASLYQPNEHRELAFRYGQDVGATALCYLAWALWHNGFLAQATVTAERAICHAREFGHSHTLVYTLWHAATVALLARDRVRVAALANEVVAISDEHGFAMWLAYGNIFAGWAAARRGEVAAGTGRMRAGIAAAAATGARLFEPLFLGLLAEGLALAGSATEALAQLDAAVAAAVQTGNAAALADLRRLRGTVLQSLGPANDDGAESASAQALAEARRQGSRFYELRAATSLARLWRDQGRGAEARDLLLPIYGWFTEGCDTPDLQEAKALLDELV
jgi:TolB-like protein/predicted ATPase/energy-coupling factor transporter ATP-binding protein EcfA2